MTRIEPFIRAEVKISRPGKHPLDFGAYRFRVLPPVGELMHVHMGATPHCLKVGAVEHFAYTESSPPAGPRQLRRASRARALPKPPPMHFAAEARKLLGIGLEGSVA